MLALAELLGDCEALTELLGLWLALGDGLTEAEREDEGEPALGLAEGELLGLCDADGLAETEAETEADGDALRLLEIPTGMG